MNQNNLVSILSSISKHNYLLVKHNSLIAQLDQIVDVQAWPCYLEHVVKVLYTMLILLLDISKLLTQQEKFCERPIFYFQKYNSHSCATPNV